MTFIRENRIRRGLLCLLAFLGPSAVAQQHSLTAREVVQRIRQHVGVPWRDQTVDTFKAGSPDTPVKGIAITMMATFDVLQRAAKAGDNFVITHEPTFYNHLDKTADFERENDSVYAAKQAFIKRHGLVVFRFHDHWHARRPDGIQAGMIHALGWEKFQNPENERLFAIPQTTVRELAASIQRRLGIRTLRVVGDPDLKVTKVGLNPGYPGFPAERHTLQRDDVEALVMGEGLEWETIEYGADAAAEGKHKALIVLGHIPSEQAGMQECATWLKTFLPGVRIDFVPAAEPFWSPH